MFINEFSKVTGLSIDTLRYYEKEGLLNPQRDSNNYRDYSEKDFCWVQLLMKMKQTDMTIENIKEYALLQEKGDITLTKRIIVLKEHLENLYIQESELKSTIKFVENKIIGYQKRIGGKN
ncbi:MerR family transcriptional regulator [Erwinia sp. CPCC 100877]|nr:MerR family transcriptional regulator [Erwinia sp. CPCC 100877]